MVLSKQQINMFLPLAMVFLLQKLEIEQMGLLWHLRGMYLCVQIGAACALLFIKSKIQDGGKEIECPEEKSMGQVVKPSKKMTQGEYDREKWNEEFKKLAIGFCVLCCIHAKWEVILPLALQSVLVPLNLAQSPLFEIYVRKMDVERPFPVENPFGDLEALKNAAEGKVEEEGAKELKQEVEGKKDK